MSLDVLTFKAAEVQYLIACEQNMGALLEAGAYHVSKCVIFLVKGEDGSGWNT
jgi:hypothetical protein